MFNFMVTNEGGLTTAGYAIAIIAGIILFLAAICFAGKHSEKHKLTTRQLVFCAVAVALSFCHFLPEDFYSAVGWKRYSLQYAVYCTGC